MWGDYQAFTAQTLRESGTILGSSFSSIANRLSYFLDVHGPSMAVDTMCSSSLTALHLACESLKRGECDAALVGGVNLSVHPQKFLYLAQERFLASDGRCRSFGEGGDGYVPGEGVGVVLLKRIDHTARTRDRVHAVVKATGVNHGGRASGYTVPNPNAQAALIEDVFRRANVPVESIGYVEAHGTGTSLGDPIEIRGLIRAFGAVPTGWACPIGSVKSNVGHLESAAGMAALAKTVLQFKHGWIAPSIHAERLNSNIDFDSIPFFVQRTGSAWDRRPGHPLRAGISSFGAGGANAHVILEEARPVVRAGSRAATAQLFPLSARTPERLLAYVQRWVEFLSEDDCPESLPDMAYSLQTGREAFEERLAIVAEDSRSLIEKLTAYMFGDMPARTWRGSFSGGAGTATAASARLAADRDLDELARLWTTGAIEIDWERLHAGTEPCRLAIPTYPFARERCWAPPREEAREWLQRLRVGACSIDEACAALEGLSGADEPF
jgi:acyl transferase domain-containing protein